MRPLNPRPFPPRRGFALIIVLCLLVIVSAILVTYTSVMSLERQSTHSYSQRIEAELLAQGALQDIQDQLFDEIEAGSTRLGRTGAAADTDAPYLYRPTAAAKYKPEPSPELAALPDAGTLVKVSRQGVPFYTGATATASTANSTIPASDGRRIPKTRWNKPALLANWPATINAPDWINITRNGPANVTVAEAKDRALSNSRKVIGRYAFAIYDVGGLLDITQAGYPTTGSDLTPKLIASKGNIALADLTAVPANGTSKLPSSQIQDFINWRNRASKAGFWEDYLDKHIVETGGLTVFPGDDTFVNRQELLRFAKDRGWEGALPYLTTFNRTLNAPSYTPAKDEANGFSYRTNMDQASAVDRDVANVRVKAGGWTRRDGTTAVTGESLLKQRFPLSKIALLSQAPVDGDTIMAYFGLSGPGGNEPWVYDHGKPTGIMTLDQVAQAGREPDFFELLKAGILSGSLGRDPGVYQSTTSGPGPRSDVFAKSTDLDYHVLRIGANIIDQYDSDNFPFNISCALFLPASTTDNQIYGTENLPLLYRVVHLAQDITPPAYNGTQSRMDNYLWPVLYNPHLARSTSGGPQTLRLQIIGRANGSVLYYRAPGASQTGTSGPPMTFTISDQRGRIQFTANQDFNSTPKALTQDMVDKTETPEVNLPGYNKPNGDQFWPNKPAAFALEPVTYFPDSFTKNPSIPNVTTNEVLAIFNSSPNLSFALQYQDGSTWRTYSIVNRAAITGIGRRFRAGTATNPNPTTGALGNHIWHDGFQMFDARTERFGFNVPYNRGEPLNATYREVTTRGLDFLWGYGNPTSGFAYSTGPSGNYYPGAMAENVPASAMRYTDKDGVMRPGDGVFAAGVLPEGYVAASNSTTGGHRPVILNRPFRSVGELGYVFRDMPFKTLDFISDKSGDTGLLDLFCINEVKVTGDKLPTRGGQVNLNSAPAPVIAALLKGGLKKENEIGNVLAADVDGLANYIANQLKTKPLTHRGELVAILGSGLNSLFATTADSANKTQRESLVRSLAETTDFRTWNLLIDVIAQAGRYPANATDISKGFVVEGERRYWLHLALDRLTGEVISQQIEPVYE